MIYYIFKCILTPFYWILFWPRIVGFKHLRVKGGVMYLSNHRSNLDPLFLGLCIPRFIHFMAKEELFENRFIGGFLRLLLAFPVKRKTADLSSVRRALKLISSGKALGIFPEGKRAITDDIDEMEKGAAFMAVRAAVPVVPMYIPPNMYGFKRPCLMVGEPIDVKSMAGSVPKSLLIDVLADKFEDSVNALKAEYEAKYAKNHRRR